MFGEGLFFVSFLLAYTKFLWRWIVSNNSFVLGSVEFQKLDYSCSNALQHVLIVERALLFPEKFVNDVSRSGSSYVLLCGQNQLVNVVKSKVDEALNLMDGLGFTTTKKTHKQWVNPGLIQPAKFVVKSIFVKNQYQICLALSLVVYTLYDEPTQIRCHMA